MEGVAADACAAGDGVAFDDLHVADGAEVLHVVLIFLLNDNALLATTFLLYAFQEVANPIRVYSSIGDKISQVLIGVLWLE